MQLWRPSDPSRWRRLSLAAFLVSGICLASVATGQDEALVADVGRLGITFSTPRTVTIFPGDGKSVSKAGIAKSGRVYWYLAYELKNDSPKEDEFFVSVRASSDKKRKYADLALAFVEKKIEHKERRQLFSKADLAKSGQKAGAYQRYAPGDRRQCVAIFNPLDAEADKIVVEVYGLVKDIQIEELGGGRFRITERVLRVTYHRLGDEFNTNLDEFKLVGQKWGTVVREAKVEPK